MGASVTVVPPPGTVNARALDQTPPCCTRATPLTAPAATAAVTCVSLQVTTCPAALPSHTAPLPCVAPKPDPVKVTTAFGTAEAGSTLVRLGVFTVNATALDQTPPCNTCACPVAEPPATAATTRLSLQLCTTPLAVPSHTCPFPWLAPNPEPAIWTSVPATPLVGEIPLIDAVLTVMGKELLHILFCLTWTVPEVALAARAATIRVSLQLTTVP